MAQIKVTLEYERGVPKEYRVLLLKYLKAAKDTFKPKHPIRIVFHNSPYLPYAINGNYMAQAGGLFSHIAHRNGRPMFGKKSVIHIAANPMCSRKMALRELPNVLLHEWAHMERYHNRKKNSEYGINVRARAMRKQIEAEWRKR